MKIDLGMGSSKRATNREFDALVALEDVNVAAEALNGVSVKSDVLTLACENIEAGVNLAEAIAAKGDENTAVTVARESLRQNLAFIGQASITDEVVTPGTESISAANESIKETLAAGWNKVKEFTKKIWDFIANLISKVINFFKGLIGKGASNYDRIDKLVKKLKADKRTSTDGELSESVQKSLANKFAALILGGKGLDSSSIKDFMNGMSDKFTNAKESDKFKDEILKELDGVEEASSVTIGALNTLLGKGIEAIYEYNNEVDSTPKGLDSGDIISEFEDKVSDHEEFKIFYQNGSFDKHYFTAVYVTEDGKKAYEKASKITLNEGATEDNKKEFIKELRKAVSGIKVINFTMEADKSELDEEYKNIDAMTFGELEGLRDDLKKVTKNAEKALSKMEDAIEKGRKIVSKAISKLDATKDANGNKVDGIELSAREAAKNFYEKRIGQVTTKVKGEAIAVAAAAKAIINGPIYDYAEESAKTYKKA